MSSDLFKTHQTVGFLVSDNDDISTTGLLENMASALDVPSRLIPIPATWFKFTSQLIGKPAISQRLCEQILVLSKRHLIVIH